MPFDPYLDGITMEAIGKHRECGDNGSECTEARTRTESAHMYWDMPQLMMCA